MENNYYENLERIVKQMLTPLKDLPFNLIIESISGKQVKQFNKEDTKHNNLLSSIIEATKIACEEINRYGIIESRANEVGNALEPFLKNALNTKSNFKAITPKTSSGKQKTVGYPDIELKFGEDEFCYIECKSYNIDNLYTTMRTFYLSPSDDFKVTKDAIHFVVSFEIYVDGRSGSKNIYKTKGWKILDVYKLNCDVKYEFNSNNKRMYDKSMILAEGKA
jgi:hypothetical protein